jgi:chemotaxis protein CheD
MRVKESFSPYRIPTKAFSGLPKAKIHVGELHASKKPTVISTLLGSCVAACLNDPPARIGGMNHILLPGRAVLGSFDDLARYGINAMELLINRLIKLGGNRQRLVAKVFGGAHILRDINENNSPGFRNGEFLLEFLEFERIPVLSHDIGGYSARMIHFRTDTGEVLLKRLPPMRSMELAASEKQYSQKIRKEVKKGGKVIYFDRKY